MKFRRIVLFIFILSLGSATMAMSETDPLDTWTRTGLNNLNIGLRDVIYANDLFVAVGRSGTILTSSDGVIWTQRDSQGVTANLNGTAYGNNTFVVVGEYGGVLTSPDGITWTNTGGIWDDLHGVTFGNDRFVAVGYHGNALTSTDGINWTIRPTPVTTLLTGVAHGNGVFVAVASNNGEILTSPDGITWTQRVFQNLEHYSKVRFVNNLFVAVGMTSDCGSCVLYGTTRTSDNGTAWTTRRPRIDQSISDVTYGNNSFLAVGFHINMSSDGVTWSSKPLGMPFLSGVVYGNGVFVGVGEYGTIMTSQDGITWHLRSGGDNSVSGGFSAITYANNTFVAALDGGAILISPDAANWMVSQSGAVALENLTYAEGSFAGVGRWSIFTSSDGNIWTRTYSFRDPLNVDVAYGNDTFVAVSSSIEPSYHNTILTSPDGVTWTQRDCGACDYGLLSVTFGKDTFVAVGGHYLPSICTSPDGVIWSPESAYGTGISLWGVTYGNNTFVAVGSSGIIYTSPDGVIWSPRESGTSNDLWNVAYNNTIFLAVGSSGTILTSSDGVIWTQRQSGITADLYDIAYGNSTFVAVGEQDSILRSDPLLPNLLVTKSGTGTGTVTSAPSGIDCGDDCYEPFQTGTVVTLTATADSGSIFNGWSGGGCSGPGPCTISMSDGVAVTASFVRLYNLSIIKVGEGTGRVMSIPAGINCGSDCSELLNAGTAITLVATADAGSGFTSWAGCNSTSDNSCAVTMTADKSVSAAFTLLNRRTLTIGKSGTGTGTVTGTGISCGDDCTESYSYGTVLTLTAQAIPGSIFVGWSGGDCSGTGTCEVTMNADTMVTAAFSLIGALPEISPTEGTVGTQIIITGSGFGTKKGKVLIGGVPTKISKYGWTDTMITSTINKPPLPAEIPHPVVIVVNKAPITLDDTFTTKNPVLDDLLDSSGTYPDEITITGMFFGVKKGKVYLEHPATRKKKNLKITSWNMIPATGVSTLTFQVPKPSKGFPAGSYPLKVDNKIGIAEASSDFTIN